MAVISRAPSLLVHPRFWAEEGTVYFAFARDHGLWRALLATHLGYYSLFDNVAALVAARALPLELAPLATTLFALAVQLTPFALVLWSESMPWKTTLGRALACAAILLAEPSGEIWLNTINSQFYLCLISFLLLIDEGSQPRVHRAFLLLLAGTSSVVSCLLVPLFVVKAASTRTRRAVVEACVFGFAACVQCAAVLASRSAVGGIDDRLAAPSIELVAAILASKTILWPIVGKGLAVAFAAWARSSLGGNSWLARTLFDASALLLVLVALFLAFGRVRRGWMYLVAYLLVSVGCIATSLGPHKEQLIEVWTSTRYFFVSSAILLLALTLGVETVLSREGRATSLLQLRALVLGSALLFGVVEFRASLWTDASWPDWRSEVSHWRADSTYRVHVWPGGTFAFSLRP